MAKRRRKLEDVEKGVPGYVSKKRPTPEKRPVSDSESRQCPRCNGFNTSATSTQRFELFIRHYRVCRSPICCHRYSKAVML